MSNEARAIRARDATGKAVTVMAERRVVNSKEGLCHWPWVYWVDDPEGKKWATLHTDGTLLVVGRHEVYRLTLEEQVGFEEEELVVLPRSKGSDEWSPPR